MGEITEVRLSGYGGQGVVLAGLLLGAAGVLDGRFVAGSNSYGAQARGSGCKAEVILSAFPIDFPHITKADILVAMSQGAYDLYYRDMKEGSGFILYDSGLVKPKEDLEVKQVGLPATETAVKKLTSKQVANIVFLGALAEITQIVSARSLRKAIREHMSERFQGLNLKALSAGMALGRKSHG